MQPTDMRRLKALVMDENKAKHEYAQMALVCSKSKSSCVRQMGKTLSSMSNDEGKHSKHISEFIRKINHERKD